MVLAEFQVGPAVPVRFKRAKESVAEHPLGQRAHQSLDLLWGLLWNGHGIGDDHLACLVCTAPSAAVHLYLVIEVAVNVSAVSWLGEKTREFINLYPTNSNPSLSAI